MYTWRAYDWRVAVQPRRAEWRRQCWLSPATPTSGMSSLHRARLVSYFVVNRQRFLLSALNFDNIVWLWPWHILSAPRSSYITTQPCIYVVGWFAGHISILPLCTGVSFSQCHVVLHGARNATNTGTNPNPNPNPRKGNLRSKPDLGFSGLQRILKPKRFATRLYL